LGSKVGFEGNYTLQNWSDCGLLGLFSNMERVASSLRLPVVKRKVPVEFRVDLYTGATPYQLKTKHPSWYLKAKGQRRRILSAQM